MKMFKRLAAVLLAGVMVLAMLTACGGGTDNSNATENKILNAFNTGSGTSYSNNAELQSKARSVLAKVENGKIKVADLPSATYGGRTMSGISDLKVNTTTGEMSFVYYMVYKPGSLSGTEVSAIEVNDEFMKQLEAVKPGSLDLNEIAGKGGNVDAIGIATFTARDGKTYFGMALKLSGSIGG